MKENESEFLATLITYIIVGAAIGTYTVENQTYTTTYNMSSDFREKTDVVLANIIPEIRGHISSINVMDDKKIKDICKDKVGVGCTNINTNIFGKITNADIYVTNNYGNKCYNFEYVLYHEIGHIDDFYLYGNWLNYRDWLYYNDDKLGEEDYADNFADQYIYNNC